LWLSPGKSRCRCLRADLNFSTAAEESTGESLDQLLAEEEPEPDPYAEADIEDDRLD